MRRKRINGPLPDRFWPKVKKTDTCWLWCALTNKDGYGRIGDKGKMALAHRISWELHYGPIPNDLNVLHKCDMPACVNPDHLFLGTQKENLEDMRNKGRCNYTAQAKGEKVFTSKLTSEDVANIRKDTRPNKPVAKDYGVIPNTIYRIRAGKSWRHLGHE